MITQFNVAMLKEYNDDPTPHQKMFLRRKAGIECEDIVKRGGASIAIANVIEAQQKRESVSKTILPGACFCNRYLEDGRADLRTIRDAKYRDGIAISQLAKAGVAFRRVVRKDKPKVIDPTTIKRAAVLLESPKLPTMDQVKRSWGSRR